MGILFGKHSKSDSARQNNGSSLVNDKDRALLQLKNARDRLKKYKRKLDSDSVKLQESALELYNNNQKNRAVLVLKLKKHKQATAERIDNQLLTVLKQIEDVEWATVNVEVIRAIEQGTKALNNIHQEISVDKVELLLLDAAEAIEVENQINQLLAGEFSNLIDADLLSELNCLGTTEISNVKEVILEFPEAPDTDIKIQYKGSETLTENNRSDLNNKKVLA
mmetsp:Transcript_6218/g.5558  ORF Transcript_6218/g.5558 Transcript_6218/m.5558 type:complete len:222 (-) Transcript_6218:532-1197(-)